MITVALAAQVAWANPLGDQGVGARAVGLLGTGTAEAKDESAAFYNPALLTVPKEFSFGIGVHWSTTPASVSAETDKPVDCTHCQPNDAAGVTLGLVAPLGGKLKDIVALGLVAHLPTGRLVHIRSPEPSRPFWYRYQSGLERLALFASAGIRIADWLRVGGGVQFLAELAGNGAMLGVDLFSKEVRFREVDSYLGATFAPVVGVAILPAPWMRLGVSYRGSVSVPFSVPATIDLEGVGALSFEVSGIDHYTAPEIVAGVAFDLSDQITLTADLAYAFWSRAPSPYPRLKVDLNGETLEALGLDKALDIESVDEVPGFADTLGIRAGVELRPSKVVSIRAGGGYRPTPVPRQDAPGTNILDASAVGVSAGVALNFSDPLELFPRPVSLGLSGQAWFFLPRRALKDDTDPMSSYRYRATHLGLVMEFRYPF